MRKKERKEGKEAGREREEERGKRKRKKKERKEEKKEGKKEAKKLWATVLPDLEWFHLTVCIFPIEGFLSGKECTCLRRRQWHPTPVLLLGKSHGWRSLVGCSPWGR